MKKNIQIFNKRCLFFFLFLFGLIIRIWCAIIDYSGDVNNHFHWGKNAVEFGFYGFYERNFPKLYGTALANYPPLANILFALFYFLYSLIGPFIWKLNLITPFFPSKLVFFWQEQKIMLSVFTKIPAILADIGIAYFIYLFAKKLTKSKKSPMPFISLLLVLFNPAFFYNSSYWGQIEALPIFFVLVSFYLLLYSKHYIWSAIMMTLAFLTKQTAAVFAPLYILLFLYQNKLVKSIKAFLISLVVFVLIFLPFNKNSNIFIYPFITYWNKIMTAFGSEYLTAHAFNFWGLTYGLGHIPDKTVLFFGVSVRWWSLAFVYLITLIALYVLYKRRFKMRDILSVGYLIPLATFLFSTRMHERHLAMTLPFMLLAGINDKFVFKSFIFISFFHFLNMYSGWWSPHIEIVIKIFSGVLITNFLILTVIFLFFSLYVKYLKRSLKN